MNLTVNQICKAYKNKAHILHLSKEAGCRQSKISQILKDNNIPIRTSRHVDFVSYELNHNYFNIINSPEKAYLLGLLYADGCVSLNSNTISLVMNDKELILFFKNQIKCNKELYINPNHKRAITFSFCSPQMKIDLMKLGCFPKKSLTLEFPTFEQVPKEFVSHFIRGYFDGDGNIYIGKTQKYFKIISSTKFCIGYCNYLNNKFGFNLKLSSEKKYKPETSYVKCTKTEQMIIIRDFMYNNDTISLKRKKTDFYKF